MVHRAVGPTTPACAAGRTVHSMVDQPRVRSDDEKNRYGYEEPVEADAKTSTNKKQKVRTKSISTDNKKYQCRQEKPVRIRRTNKKCRVRIQRTSNYGVPSTDKKRLHGEQSSAATAIMVPVDAPSSAY
ncbi:hypothetical protein DCS_05640 [Drechmeria coniospora]|uniref:Uncharacterized protein n=1 Tax=Drechmeria coniospora TaxID=98403 RepID=A0A151GND9_DRECN|nr:hypothetical protein DCS_05640 [Drechmeria coniospora]KYK58623.1 hypothetical protein DCS_05640 [Drechmeria coniospora]